MENGDIVNNLAYNIAKRKGFKGSLGMLINNQALNLEVNQLAKEFLERFAEETINLG
jgi:hypothetical protein